MLVPGSVVVADEGHLLDADGDEPAQVHVTDPGVDHVAEQSVAGLGGCAPARATVSRAT